MGGRANERERRWGRRRLCGQFGRRKDDVRRDIGSVVRRIDGEMGLLVVSMWRKGKAKKTYVETADRHTPGTFTKPFRPLRNERSLRHR